MARKKQIIKLKPSDVDQAVVRNINRSIWEKVKLRPVKEQVHGSRKKKVDRYKKDPLDDY